MATAAWRYLLSAISLFALFIAVGDAFDAHRFGDTGIAYKTVSESEAIVRDVEPKSQAARAGVRNGDRIRASWLRSDAVFQQPNPFGPRSGEVVTFYDYALRHNVNVVATPIPSVFSAGRILAHVLRIALLLIALTLFWNLAEDRAGRSLGAFLLSYNLQGFGNSGTFAFSHLSSALMIAIAGQAMLPMLLLFFCWFPDRHPSDARRAIAIMGSLFGAALIVFQVTSTLYAQYGKFPHLPNTLFFDVTSYAAPIVFALLYVAALVIDFRRSAPMDRLRLEWVAIGAALIAYPFLTLTILPANFVTFGGGFTSGALIASDLSEFAGAVCIVYAFLRYRVLDLTFAISQATVYALLSSLIVAAFILVEYLVGKYVEAHSHLTGAIITLAFALALGIGLRAIHRNVDRFADRIIFRARYKAEEGLRSFGRRTSFFTNEKGLQDTTVAALSEYARAQSAAIYLVDRDGDFTLSACCPGNAAARISHEDPAVLALKDERRPQLLPRGSRVDGELAFPMFARGELMGFVSCGKRRVRETYAPDEIDAMNYALEHVGVQLDAIRTARLETQIREIQRIVSAYHMLGADPQRVLAHITDVSGVNESGYEESTTWKTLTRATGQSAPKTSSTT